MLTISLALFTSCDSLHEDMQPCPEGLRLRFVYDYNMEFANAFPSQVDCLTVLFFNEDGSLVKTEKTDSHELADENWRMTVDLAPGSYNILAYGGMGFDDSDFHFVTDPTSTSYTDIRVQLNENCLGKSEGTNLHPLFYGSLSTEVKQNSTEYTEATVKMMKDTNNLRIVLQQADGEPVDNKDFNFCVTDDNTLFAYNNDIIPTKTVTYNPWTRGNASPGVLPDGSEATVAFAEMSLRLMTASHPRLIVTRKNDGEKVIDIPLINYLLMLKSQQFMSMGPQEFLDRESRWNMIFFLDRNHNWLKTQIVINDWVVRINNTEL